jgi:hypothetical protein
MYLHQQVTHRQLVELVYLRFRFFPLNPKQTHFQPLFNIKTSKKHPIKLNKPTSNLKTIFNRSKN